MNQAIRWAGESECRVPIDYGKPAPAPIPMYVKIKRGPGKGRVRTIMVVPSGYMTLERASRRFMVDKPFITNSVACTSPSNLMALAMSTMTANLKKHDGVVASVLHEDVIGKGKM